MTNPANTNDLDPKSAPRYVQIQKELEGRIVDGTYAIGTLLPPEINLAEEYATSRSTIREALRFLSERGYVDRRQGVGTRVVSASSQSRYVQSFSSLEELFQVSKETYFVIMGTTEVELDAELAATIGGQEGETWLEISGVRWTEPGGKPICYVQSYVPKRFETVAQDFHKLEGPFFSELERHSDAPIEEVQQQIRALPFPVQMSRLLGLRDESWSLQLMRRYLTSNGVLIASLNWHPAEQMSYVMRIRRQKETDVTV